MPLDEFDDRRAAPRTRAGTFRKRNRRSEATSVAPSNGADMAGLCWAFAALVAVILGAILC